MPDRLIVFARNLIKGNVKTRIASVIGSELALEVYKLLYHNTIQMVKALSAYIEPVIYFSEFVVPDSDPILQGIRPEVQEGNGLGERMANSFKKEFASGARKVCIIGTDIYGLNTEIIVEAFNRIQNNNVVIGPATDGGYYLFGASKFNTHYFSGIKWGESTVMKDTINNIDKMGMDYDLLEHLNDVDEYYDIPISIKNKLNLK